jgi:pheromone a factor receptor
MYIHLLALSSGDVVFTVPLMTAMLVFNASKGVEPWISWADTHSNFDRADQYPLTVWRESPTSGFMVEWTRWSAVFCAFVFVAIFAGSAKVQAKGASAARAVVGAIRSHFGKRLHVSARSTRSTSPNHSDAASV